MDFLKVARAYLSMGKPVIPLCPADHQGVTASHLEKCQHPGKTPLITSWQRYGQDFPTGEQIEAWARQWPGANVGGPTGPLWGVALDVDPRHGGDLELSRRHWSIPDTPTSLTGGGGAHYLFQHPGVPVPNRVNLAPGLDVRGDGGQIVLPPSAHVSGRIYAWELTLHPYKTPLAPMPGWLRTALSLEPPKTVPGPVRLTSRDTCVLQLLRSPIHEGRRNASLCRIAWLLHLYLKPPLVDAMLQVVNDARCVPPLDPKEVAAIVQSVNRYSQPGVNGHPKALVPTVFEREEQSG